MSPSFKPSLDDKDTCLYRQLWYFSYPSHSLATRIRIWDAIFFDRRSLFVVISDIFLERRYVDCYNLLPFLSWDDHLIVQQNNAQLDMEIVSTDCLRVCGTLPYQLYLFSMRMFGI
ncbi:hypothetical protein CDAR_13611 [Caerostris darwini]|uniref:Rab-GAP TBC domain-containing protein n=1 Tax=Caerostris darwini TaxID=1538125 RepID=A0AAV4VL55_9ARAC|nr:hypothetical protein CDAR_13611 [Caerostris darwini]